FPCRVVTFRFGHLQGSAQPLLQLLLSIHPTGGLGEGQRPAPSPNKSEQCADWQENPRVSRVLRWNREELVSRQAHKPGRCRPKKADPKTPKSSFKPSSARRLRQGPFNHVKITHGF